MVAWGMDRPDDAPPLPEIHHVTEGWHTLHCKPDGFGRETRVGRVCEHWVSYNTPVPVYVMTREGVHLANPDGSPKPVGPGPVRSYVGLVLEVGDAQLQVRGRLLLGDDRMKIELVG